jgi:polyisoprenoid-binding protein YceI
MNKIATIVLLAGLTILAACKEKKQPLDACGCARERFNTGLKGENLRYCDSLRHGNAQFETEFQKCYYAMNFGGDSTGKAPVDERKMEAISGPSAGGYTIAGTESKVTWIGREASGKTHTGNVNIKSGSLDFEASQLKGGTVVFDMNSITNTDITDEAGKAKLVGHLKSADFFDVANHGEASYTITSLQAKNSREYTVKGNLTLKGITQPAEGDINISSDGSGKLSASGMMKFDRSLFNVKFRSDKFETGLGDKFINNEILLHFNVLANKK